MKLTNCNIVRSSLYPKFIFLSKITWAIILLMIFSNCTSETDAKLENSSQGEVISTVVEKDSIDPLTGLIIAEGFPQVKALCTPCHSAKLVTQNRASREGWEQMIRWMQETQNLKDLGTNEPIVLDYLAANYAPQEIGRRTNLDVEDIEWYILELE